VARSLERQAAPLGVGGLIALTIPAAVCFAGWFVQATVRYSTDSPLALPTALAFVGGSFAATISVVVLTAKIAGNPAARRWPECLVLALSLLSLIPGLLVLTALAFRP
jgi:hypothetical protein